MKTVTLWNIPIDVAKIAIKALREKAGEMITTGTDISEIEKLMWAIQSCEEEINKE